MRVSEKLTAARVRQISMPGRYGDGDGLVLQVGATGSKSWVFRYVRDGHERWLGLGPEHTIGLSEARQRARVARQHVLDGGDPVATKQAARAARIIERAKTAAVVTFAEAATRFHAANEKKWRSAKHAAQILTTLQQYAFPTLGARDVARIDTPDVLAVLEPHWEEKPETMNRLRGRIEQVLDFARVRGWRSGDNPARWKGHLKLSLPDPAKIKPVRHFTSMNYRDVPAFMGELAKRDAVAALALRFAILTASRTGPVIEATWDEIDFETRLWTIPAAKMKASRKHVVPLSGEALEVLRRVPREAGNEHVFIGPKSGSGLSSMAMLTLLKRMQVPATTHGFRSSFKTWARSLTSHAREIVEEAMAHSLSALDDAYIGEAALMKRRLLMNDWARYCATPRPSSASVVPLRSGG